MPSWLRRSTLRELREHGNRYCSRHWSSLHAEFSGHIPDQVRALGTDTWQDYH